MSAQLKKQPRLRECPICRDEYRSSAIGGACSLPCSLELKRQRERKRAALVEKRSTQAALQDLKTLKQLCVETQKPVNKYVRIRDAGKNCISCNGPVQDAGHFFPIGSKWQIHRLRFDTRCIFGQCRKCNSYTGGGNLHGYIAGVVARYGQERLDEMYEIKRQAEHGEMAPLTRDEVLVIAADHRRMARELVRVSTGAVVLTTGEIR